MCDLLSAALLCSNDPFSNLVHDLGLIFFSALKNFKLLVSTSIETARKSLQLGNQTGSMLAETSSPLSYYLHIYKHTRASWTNNNTIFSMGQAFFFSLEYFPNVFLGKTKPPNKIIRWSFPTEHSFLFLNCQFFLTISNPAISYMKHY